MSRASSSSAITCPRSSSVTPKSWSSLEFCCARIGLRLGGGRCILVVPNSGSSSSAGASVFRVLHATCVLMLCEVPSSKSRGCSTSARRTKKRERFRTVLFGVWRAVGCVFSGCRIRYSVWLRQEKVTMSPGALEQLIFLSKAGRIPLKGRRYGATEHLLRS